DLELAERVGELQRGVAVVAVPLLGEVLLDGLGLAPVELHDELGVLALGGAEPDAGDGRLAAARAPPPTVPVGGLGITERTRSRGRGAGLDRVRFGGDLSHGLLLVSRGVERRRKGAWEWGPQTSSG